MILYDIWLFAYLGPKIKCLEFWDMGADVLCISTQRIVWYLFFFHE